MIERFMPTRKNAKLKASESVLVADLDSMISKTVQFKVHGKIHEIPPQSVESFMIFTHLYSEILKLQERVEPVSAEELVSAYFKMINSVCKTISRQDVNDMTQHQVAALFQLMTDINTGKVFVDQKKTLEKMATLLSTQQS